MKKILAFDSLRFLACIAIMLHHIGINIYLYHGLPNPYFGSADLAVEIFLILSGFLLAKHYFSYLNVYETPGQNLRNFAWGKIKRLYPEYVVAVFLCLVLTNLFAHHVSLRPLGLNLMMIGGMGGVPNIINGVWYVVVVFWGSLLAYSLMTYKRDFARYVLLPILSFLCLFYLMNHCWSISGHQQPIEFSLFSRGMIRGFLGLTVGIYCYQICQWIKNLNIRWNPKAVTCALFCGEVLSIIVLFREIILRNHHSISDFGIYFYGAFIIGLLYFHREKVLKFLSWRIWGHVAYLAYTIYLTHLILIEILRKHWLGLSYMSPWCSYPIIIILCIVFGWAAYQLQKWIFIGLRKLFVQESIQQ